MAEMMLDGTMCCVCGVYLENEKESGVPTPCEDCKSEFEKNWK